MASTDPNAARLPAVVRAAAAGELPSWAEAGEERRKHMARVADLLDSWAAALDLPDEDRIRWRAVGWLHDALRDAPAGRLVREVPEALSELPPLLLHGPAAAERLAGQVDERMLDAIRYHTIGHPSLDRLGRALYLADFLEPGRDFLEEWRDELRARMPGEMDEVLREVLAARMRHIIEGRKPLRPETAAFWSSLVEEPA